MAKPIHSEDSNMSDIPSELSEHASLDDESSESSSESAVVEPPEDDHVEVVVEEAWNCLGLKDYDLPKPLQRAACEICGKVVKDRLRMEYRFRVSNSMRDQKRVHIDCLSQLPMETRERDVRQVRRWMSTAGVSIEVHLHLTDALAELNKPG